MNNTTRIECPCKVCHGRAAEVSTNMVAGRTDETLKTITHNLVQLAHTSPMLAGPRVKAVS